MPTGRPRSQVAAAGLLVLGLALIVLSIVWPSLTTPADVMTPERRRELADAKAAVLALEKKVFEAKVRVPTLEGKPLALQKASEHLEAIRAELRSAAEAPKRAARRLRLLGAGVLASGVVFYFCANRRPSPSDGAPGR